MLRNNISSGLQMCRNIFVILAHFVILFSLGVFPSAVLLIPGMIKDKVFICESLQYIYTLYIYTMSIDVHIYTVYIFGKSTEMIILHREAR